MALGIGSMVGAGIFALLGEAAALAGSAVWISFLVSGLVALLSGYSFVQMGIRYPSRGGIVEYLVQGFGPGLFSGAVSVLFYFAQLIGMAMIALAFGKYLSRLLDLYDNVALYQRIFGSGLVIGLTALQLSGSGLISRIQRLIVLGNLVLLSAVAIALFSAADASRLAISPDTLATPVLGSLALTFFAYTGFSVICNSVEDMREPSRDLPRAMFGALIVVILLYQALAIATVMAVSREQLATSGPLLLVEAARAVFGEVGFSVLLVSAIIATITCANGGLYGVTNITFSLAEKGRLPSRFSEKNRASTHGLTISAVTALLVLNSMNLSTVASLGSATSLFVYFLVNLGACRVIKGGRLQRLLLGLSALVCFLAIIVWLTYTLLYTPRVLWVFLVFLSLALVVEMLMQRYGRRIIGEGLSAESSK